MKNLDEKVNLNNIKFFYSDEDSIENFLLEMNNKFAYQTLVFVNAKENEKNDLVENAKKLKIQNEQNFSLKFEFVNYSNENLVIKNIENTLNNNLENILNKNFENVVNKEEVCALVCFDGKDLQDCAKFCRKYYKKLVLYFDDYVSLNYFNPNILNVEIIGVVAKKKAICQNIKNFSQKYCFELGTVLFFDLEEEINNLCFDKKHVEFQNQTKNDNFQVRNQTQDYQTNKQIDFQIKKQNCDNVFDNSLTFDLVNDIIQNFDVDYDKLVYNYVSLINVFLSKKPSIFDEVFKNLMQENKNNFEYFSCIFGEIMLNLYELFIENFTPKLKTYVEIGVINTQCFDTFFTFEQNFDETRFWFVMAKLKNNLLNKIKNYLSFIENIKQKCYLIDIYSTCEILKNCDFGFVKQIIKEISFTNSQNSLLKIINLYGYLQF